MQLIPIEIKLFEFRRGNIIYKIEIIQNLDRQQALLYVTKIAAHDLFVAVNILSANFKEYEKKIGTQSRLNRNLKPTESLNLIHN